MPYSFLQKRSSQSAQFHTERTSSDRVRCILFVSFYAVLVNLPYWIASRSLGIMSLGWFSVEYAFVGLLALYLPRAVTAVLLLLVIAADVVSGVSKTYFLAPSECLTNLGSLHEFSSVRLLTVAGVIALALCVAEVAMRLPSRAMSRHSRHRAAMVLLAFIGLAVFTDCISRATHLPNLYSLHADSERISYFKPSWICRYPAIRLVRAELTFGGARNAAIPNLNQAPAMASASDAGLQNGVLETRSTPGIQPNVVVVLTESWGLSRNSLLRDALVSPYAQAAVQARYTVSQGSVPFFGPTIGGEARELCNSRIGARIMNVPRTGLGSCLPERLDALGYRSVALHGMDGHMYHRLNWYRSIGFQQQLFRDDFRQQGMPDCLGPFPGTCDATIAGWIANRLEQKEAQPSFVYWVTLNSHLPVPVPAVLLHPASCSLTPLLAARPALCSWYQLVTNVHQSVARVALSSLSRPTIFVIVGDHAPPFANAELRSQFSSEEVPYVVLTPRQSPAASPDLPAQTPRLQASLIRNVTSCSGTGQCLPH